MNYEKELKIINILAQIETLKLKLKELENEK